MSRFGYTGDERFRPISGWGYVGYTLLFSIPVLGLILLIVFAISDKNINRRSFARSFWCFMLLGLIGFLVVFLLTINAISGLPGYGQMGALEQFKVFVLNLFSEILGLGQGSYPY